MSRRRGLAAGALAAVWLAVAGAAAPEARAQTTAGPIEAGAAEAALSEAELDALVGPVALYPDALLAQVFVAATYPLDVVKAARWVEDNAERAQGERAAAAEAEGWDASLVALAAGFPGVVTRMSEEVAWTERLGDALLAQSADVLDAVQRMRARAAATGFLASGEAQTVVETEGAISIEPADPEVVYVPAYDPQVVYTQEVASAPVVAENDADLAGLVATGVLAFGGGMLVNEIFDDDDDDWNGYWRPGPPHFGWNDGGVYPRPGRRPVVVDGDVNIDVARNRFDRDRLEIGSDGRWRPDPDRRREARDKLAARRNGEGGKPLSGRGAVGGGGDRAILRENLSAAGKGGGAGLLTGASAGAGGGRKDGGGGALGKIKANGQAGNKLHRPAPGGSKPRLKRPQEGREGLFSNAGGGLTTARQASDRGKLSAALAKGGGGAKPAGGGRRPALKPGGGSGGSVFSRGHGGKPPAVASARGGKSLKKRKFKR